MLELKHPLGAGEPFAASEQLVPGINPDFLRDRLAVPLGVERGAMRWGVANADDAETLAALRFASRGAIVRVPLSETEIRTLLGGVDRPDIDKSRTATAISVAIVPSAPSMVQQLAAWAKDEKPERLLVDLAAILRSGRSAREALDALAAAPNEPLRAVAARVAAGQGPGRSIRAETAMPRWIDAALEIDAKHNDARHLTIIATWIDRLAAGRRAALTGAPETIALVVTSLMLVAATGGLGPMVAALMIAGSLYVLAPAGPVGRAIAEARTARFLGILSALIELGANAAHAVDLAADEIGDAHKTTALRAAVGVATKTVPLDRLLAVPLDLPPVSALLLSGDALPGDAAALAAADLQARAVRGIGRALTIARVLAILLSGVAIAAAMTR